MFKYAYKAAAIARKYHAGQKYGDKDYYLSHVCKVAYESLMEESADDTYDDEIMAVAYLHDILEDTDCCLAQLDSEFPKIVCEAVIAMTRGFYNKDKTYKEYLERCKVNPIARVVKIADSKVNLRTCIENGEWSRAKKYLDNLIYLEK